MVHCIRRLLFCIIAFFIDDFGAIQFQMLYLLNLFLGIYYGNFYPRSVRHINLIELFNEFQIQVFCLHLVCFTDMVSNNELKYSMGYSAIAFVSLICLFNLGIVIFVGGRRFMLLF
jgi:hypothetical protein